MSRIGDAARALLGREANLGALLGDESRVRRSAGQVVTQERALKNSVWWAGLNLRANVESSFPIDVVRKSGSGLMVAVPNPGPLLSEPFPGQDISEFIYATRIDKDRYGNTCGIIRERNRLNLPLVVELQSMSNCSAIMDGGRIVQWRFGSEYYDPKDVWHERQYVMPGLQLGLSPLAYAAQTMGIYQSTQDFASDWFEGKATPRGVLRNTQRGNLEARHRREAKEQFKNSTAGGDIFVTGVEWEWLPSQTTAATAGFLEQKTSSEKDVARYVGVPASMVDVEVSTGNVTYGNVTQFNLQFLVTQMGPATRRTERYWSRNAVPRPWEVKMNTDALLRMDPVTKSELMIKLSGAKLRVPSEIRALDNLPPYDEDQLAELAYFAQLGKPATPTTDNREAQPWQPPS